jgi:hypothetical protein
MAVTFKNKKHGFYKDSRRVVKFFAVNLFQLIGRYVFDMMFLSKYIKYFN